MAPWNKRCIVYGLVFIACAVIGYGIARQRSTSPQVPPSIEPIIHEVALLTDQVEPSIILIHPMEYVQFNSKDGKKHLMAQGQGDEFEKRHDHNDGALTSGMFGPDEGYRVQFKRPGTYHFHDHINPKLFATIVVFTDDPKKP